MRLKSLILTFAAAVTLGISGCRFDQQDQMPIPKNAYEACLNAQDENPSKALCDDYAPFPGL